MRKAEGAVIENTKYPFLSQFDELLPIIQQVPTYQNICTETLDFDFR